MSATNIITTAAVVAGGGLVAAVAYAQFQKGRALASGTKAAQQLAAASGDPSMLNAVLDALKGAGGESSGASRAAGGIASNDNAGEYGIAVLNSAKQAMRQAGTPAGLGRNLRVIRPLDKKSQWGIGEGCWLPEEGADNGFRTEPVESVRGLNMGYALTYLPDVYPAPAAGGAVVCYPTRYGSRRVGNTTAATEAGLAHAYQIMISSTAQGGGVVALWNVETQGFMPAGTADVQWAIQWPANRAEVQVQIGNIAATTNLESEFLPMMLAALKKRTIIQPFPPIRLVSKR